MSKKMKLMVLTAALTLGAAMTSYAQLCRMEAE